MGRDIKVISYNLRKHAASHELADLVATWDPDVLCIQEAHTEHMPVDIGPLALADSTKTNRLGLALYVRRERFDLLETKTFTLKKGMHDLVFSPTHERLLAARVHDHASQRDIVVASFHASPLTAPNSLNKVPIA